MKIDTNWKNLLYIAGVQPLKKKDFGQDEYDLSVHDYRYLETLFSHIDNGKSGLSIESHLLQEKPSTETWINAIKKSFVSNNESGDFADLPLTCIEFPMQGLVTNMNRLGLATVSSCCGHGFDKIPGKRRHPYLSFSRPNDTYLGMYILKSSGFKCHIGQYDQLVINENQSRLLEAAILLSEYENVDHFRSQILVERENLLLKLLEISGRSGDESEIGKIVYKLLKSRLDFVEIDKFGNVLGYKTSHCRLEKPSVTILLSAHLDVYDNSGEGRQIIRNENILMRNGGILGADDRAGIAMIINCLDMLCQSDHQVNLKIAMTCEEEVGQIGAKKIDARFFEGVDFAISLDRKGRHDIVYKNPIQVYCNKQKAELFENLSMRLWGKEGETYKACIGGISDLRVWSALGIPSVNLSIGFNHEHTSEETLDLQAWHRAHELLVFSIKHLKFELSPSYPRSSCTRR